jgi:hypothetical protein
MDPEPALYTIRINGHLGPTALAAFPAMVPHRQAACTVLTGHLDQSALYGVLAEAEALGLELLEVHKLVPTRNPVGPASAPDPVQGDGPARSRHRDDAFDRAAGGCRWASDEDRGR